MISVRLGKRVRRFWLVNHGVPSQSLIWTRVSTMGPLCQDSCQTWYIRFLGNWRGSREVMMSYPKERPASVLKKLLPPQSHSIPELATADGISGATL